MHSLEKPPAGSVVLHWVGAVLILAALLGGLYVSSYAAGCCSPERRFVFLVHAYAGITVLGLAVVRLILRSALRWPEPEGAGHGRIGHAVATMVHFSLYGIMILIPLTGWILVSSMPCCWGVPGLPDVRVLSFGIGSETMISFAMTYRIHVVLAWITIGLILMHVGAALFHHLVLRNHTLRRMLPGHPHHELTARP